MLLVYCPYVETDPKSLEIFHSAPFGPARCESNNNFDLPFQLLVMMMSSR